MKRIIVLISILLSINSILAQSNKSLVADTTVYGSTSVYAKPNVNPLKLFGSPFASHFAEVKYLLSTQDKGFGASYTYLPEVWGYNIGGAYTDHGYWLNGGATYRMSKPWSKWDWHVYGAAGVKSLGSPLYPIRPTTEIGVRWASSTEIGKFCFSSGAIGLITDYQTVYVTINFSILIGILASAGILLGFANQD